MKCPYRPVTTTTNNSVVGGNTIKTEFAECYYSNCPWYLPECTTKYGKFNNESCQRCHMENTQANNKRERYRR